MSHPMHSHRLISMLVVVCLLVGAFEAGPAEAGGMNPGLVTCPTLPLPASPVSSRFETKRLTLGGLALELEGDRLRVYNEDSLSSVRVSQMYYGDTKSIYVTRSGDVAVIGTGNSYLVDAREDDAQGNLALKATRLPMLFDEPCGFMTRLVGGCLVDPGAYSVGLKAAYVSGYDQHGVYRTLIYGLGEGPLDLANGPFSRILADLPESNAVLLLASDGRMAIFNGQNVALCQ